VCHTTGAAGLQRSSRAILLAQVIAEFATISESTGESSGTYPEPAKSLAGVLDTTNLNLLNFITLDCIAPSATFYGNLKIKTIAPLVPLVLLWLPSLTGRLRCKDTVTSDRRAAGFSVLWLVIILPSTASTIFSAFVCDSFEDGFFLRADLVLPCNDGQNRRFNVLWAGLMTLLYPVGVPIMIVTILVTNKETIKKVLVELKTHELQLQRRSNFKQFFENENKKERRASFTAQTEQLLSLCTIFQKYAPSAWWFFPAQLLLRMAQSSMMTLVKQQSIQVLSRTHISIIR